MITQVQPEDSGTYSCEAERLDGGLASAVSLVRVLSPARVTIREAGPGVRVRRGARLGLVCRGEGRPLPLVSWWAGHTKLSRSGVGVARLELDTREGWERDTEQFTCRGHNGVGSPAQAAVTVTVLGPPEVKLSSGVQVCSLDVKCRVSSTTPAVLKWWYNGLLLHSGKIPEVKQSETFHGLIVDINIDRARAQSPWSLTSAAMRGARWCARWRT